MQETEIQSLFDDIAPRYDKTNDYISGGMHRIWNRRFIRELIERAPHAQNILDLCCGTGELSVRHMAASIHPAAYTLADFSQKMIDIAKSRTEKTACTCIQANAKELPLSSNSFDLVMVSYGVRNIDDLRAAFREVFRVLKPRGLFAILELTRPEFFLLRMLHSIHVKFLLPQIGKLLTNNPIAYGHLRDSVHTFMDPKLVLKELEKSGFDTLEKQSYHGGIASAFFARRP